MSDEQLENTGLQTDSLTPPDSGDSSLQVSPSMENMETVMLEVSPTEESIDLGSDDAVLSQTSLEPIEKDASAKSVVLSSPEPAGGSTGKENETTTESLTESMANMVVSDISRQVSPPAGTTPASPASISKYFMDDSAAVGSQDNFFDSLGPLDDASSNTEDSSREAAPVNKEEDINLDDKPAALKTPMMTDVGTEPTTRRLRQVSQSEEVSVDFEEAKGQRPPVVSASMENVRKFFTEDVGGEDVEGKSFFDTFTAGAADDKTGTTLTVLDNNSDVPVAPGLTAQVPQTPPIPAPTSPLHSPTHGPPLPSPLPSPAHHTKDNQSKSRTSSLSEDPFSISMKMNDSDRCHDAWIPSEATRQTLVGMVTSAPGTYFPEPGQLTMPGLQIDDPQGDPVKDLVKRFMGEQEAGKRTTLTSDAVPQNEEGLRQLIDNECWRAAVDLTGVLLTEQGQGCDRINQISKHSTYSLQLWFTRIALLMKLRLYSHAESECQAFGNLDRPDLYYEFYPDTYSGRKGAIVPFSFRVLHAELPQFLGKSQESLDRLHYLHAVVIKILSNLEGGLAEAGSMLQLTDKSRKASREVWEGREKRLLYSIGNCLLHIKDFNTAVTVFESLLKKDEKRKSELLSGIGRIHLQIGDMTSAEKYFNQAEQASSKKGEKKFRVNSLINKGLIALGKNNLSESREHFKEAVDLDPDDPVAVNNMAVCCLYMGRLREALQTLEALVHRDPARFLQEGILFNLCTLYELESSRSINKKQMLLNLVSKHKGNGFSVACLKMT